MSTCDSESLSHALFSWVRYFLKYSDFQEFSSFPSFSFLSKKGFSSSKTLYLALAFMSQSGHELKRALPFAAVGRRIEVLE